MSIFRVGARLAMNALLGRPPGRGLPDLPEDFGISLSDPACRERTQAILGAFFTGVDAGLRRPRSGPMEPRALPPLYHPFYWEGTAMGQTCARRFTLRRPLSLEEGTFSRDEPFSFMRVVGVGFALGFLRPGDPGAARRAAGRFGNYGLLVPDGFGFAVGLFRWRGGLEATLRGLDRMEGLDRSSALNGLGRSLWFRFMDRPLEAVEALRRTGEGPALLGGMGLAAAFTFPDGLERAYRLASSLPPEEERAFTKGVRIALFVRHRHQDRFLEESLASQAEGIRRRAGEDLAVALQADRETHEDPLYIHLFHERCREGSVPGQGGSAR